MVGVASEEEDDQNHNLNVETDRDRLSDLSLDIQDMILSKFPFKEAIRASILSKQWKDKWSCISRFELDCKRSSYDDPQELAKQQRPLIYLYLHYQDEGTIYSFKIRGVYFHQDDLNSCIHILSKKGVKELAIEFPEDTTWARRQLVLPVVSVFALTQLQYLELSNCDFGIPSSIGGLKRLTNLILVNVRIYAEELNHLIHEYLKPLENVRICGENLKHVKFDSSTVKNIRLENTKNLVSICYLGRSGSMDVCNVLFTGVSCVSNLETISIHIDAFLGFSRHLNERMNHEHLSVLNLQGWLGFFLYDLDSQIKMFSNVLGCFPNIRKLNFSVYIELGYNPQEHNVDQIFSFIPIPNLDKLEAISVDCGGIIRIWVLEGLLRFMIAGSPLLKTLEIRILASRRWKKIIDDKELDLLFQRLIEVSPKIKIVQKAGLAS